MDNLASLAGRETAPRAHAPPTTAPAAEGSRGDYAQEALEAPPPVPCVQQRPSDTSKTVQTWFPAGYKTTQQEALLELVAGLNRATDSTSVLAIYGCGVGKSLVPAVIGKLPRNGDKICIIIIIATTIGSLLAVKSNLMALPGPIAIDVFDPDSAELWCDATARPRGGCLCVQAEWCQMEKLQTLVKKLCMCNRLAAIVVDEVHVLAPRGAIEGARWTAS